MQRASSAHSSADAVLCHCAALKGITRAPEMRFEEYSDTATGVDGLQHESFDCRSVPDCTGEMHWTSASVDLKKADGLASGRQSVTHGSENEVTRNRFSRFDTPFLLVESLGTAVGADRRMTHASDA